MGLKRLQKPTILGNDGKPIVLNSMERHHAEWTQRQVNERFSNALGYEVPIDTLTTIMKKISEQKFYDIAVADYIPLVVGEGAFSAQLTTYRSYDIAGSFESGMINTGAGNSRLAGADAAVDALNLQVFNWAKTNSWSIFDLELAAKSGNWGLVEAKERARKKNWDLGIQQIAFLGAAGLNGAQGACLGLLNQAGITTNLTVITKAISSMTTDELKAFQKAAVEAYRVNANRSAWPDRLAVPEGDYIGMVSQASAEFPIKSVLELLEESFQAITRNKGFKILPVAYGDPAYNSLGVHKYAMYRSDEESIRMNIPVDYTNSLANSINNFQFENVGYGQFTGVTALRPAELLYFQY